MKNIEYYYKDLYNNRFIDNIRNFALANGMKQDISTSIFQDLLAWLNEEHQILDDAEKKYLGNIIKPLKTKYTTVTKMYLKTGDDDTEYEYILIEKLCNHAYGDSTVTLPAFMKGTMYKGMITYKEYTLEELGL